MYLHMYACIIQYSVYHTDQEPTPSSIVYGGGGGICSLSLHQTFMFDILVL